MPQYIMTYLGGQHPSDPEESRQHFARYMDWLNSLGAAAVSPANPLRDTRTVNPDGSVSEGGASGMSGYTIVEADSFDAALAMAMDCPFLEIGGALEVSELIEMPMQT